MRSWSGTRDADNLNPLNRRRAYDAGMPVGPVFFSRDDHATTETERRSKNDDGQQYPVHFLSFQIRETSTMSCPQVRGRKPTVGNMVGHPSRRVILLKELAWVGPGFRIRDMDDPKDAL